MSKAKRNSLLLLSLAALLILVLAAGIPGLKLSGGLPFSLAAVQPGSPGADAVLPGGGIIFWLLRGFLALMVVGLPIYIIYSLFSPEGRRRLLANVIMIGLLLLLADYLHSIVQNSPAKEPPPLAVPPQSPGPAFTNSATTQFTANPPAWLTPVVILGLSISIVGLAWLAIRFIQQRRSLPGDSYADLAREAQAAIDALQVGGDLNSSILQCYREMTRIVKEERGITRQTAMTAREFETVLAEKGLPRQSIQTLTRLFEQVRYGALPTGPREHGLAVACLTEIVDACKSAGAVHEAR